MNTEFVNLIDYPIDSPESVSYKTLVADLRKRLSNEGMINLTDFLTPEGVLKYKQEIEAKQNISYHAISERHPYGYDHSDDFPSDHPRNIFGPTESFRLARHHLPDTAIDALYCWPPMRRFVADITVSDEIYLSGDPSNGLVVQFYKEGCGQAWHFDQALFSTIINIGESEDGGYFECVPNLRSETEPNYDEVKQVLSGESARIQKHKVKAGSFSIMLGRYTLHRVTPVERSKPRISVILSYELQPDVCMDLATRRKSFGPTTPELP
jgi:hypothetical protein